MPTITLTITDTQARILAALELQDTKTIDERFSVYLRDIVRNGAGIELDRPEDIVLMAVLALESEAELVAAERVLAAEKALEAAKEAVEKPKEEPVVEAKPETISENIVNKQADQPFDYPELTPPAPKPEITPITEI